MTPPPPAPFTIPPTTTVGAVTLAVADLNRTSRFYQDAIGLRLLAQDARSASLGIDGQPIVHLLARPEGKAYRRATGLYHLAILLPSRAHLGQWLRHYVTARRRMIDGAGDHLVSEALYLSDPEGNGIEMYRDRPRETWEFVQGQVRMDTLAVDLPALIADADPEPFTALPAGTRLGHIHLQVHDIPAAVSFYHNILGFETMMRLPTAAFVAAGGYHHHIGMNVWHSRGAAPPPADALGLVHYTVVLPHEAARQAVLARLEAAGAAVWAHEEGVMVRDNAGIHILLTLPAS